MHLFKPVPGDERLTTFPISRPELFKYYKDASNSYWTVDELKLAEDAEHYNNLSAGEKRFVKYVLAFFAASDGIVNINLAARFKNEVKILEAGYFYDFQIMMENVHAHTYSLLLDTIIPSKAERDHLLNAMHDIPVIKKIAEYMFTCIKSDAPFAERLLRMACVEGILFTGMFCVIYWLQKRGLMPGLGQSNELISRDEALHTTFALFLYTMLESEHKLSNEHIYAIMREAVDLAREFMADALPIDLPEMNIRTMGAYIESQADNLLSLIEVPILYRSVHGLHYMDQINMQNRSNFFERRVSEYSKPISPDTDVFAVNYDF